MTGHDSDPTKLVDPEENVDLGEVSTDGPQSTNAAVLDELDRPRRRLSRLAGYALLSILSLALTGAAGYFKYQDAVAAETERVRAQSVQIATEATIDLLSYTPDTAETKLNAASARLTGSFRDSYLSLVHDVVIPGAKQKRISANATVPAGASVSASADKAKVMVFVNQTVTVGNDSPTDTASVVEISLEKVDGRWLISGFEPR
jgi:Mce-associated membrane protein